MSRATRRGFVLTLDAFFAVLLASAFLISIQFFYSSHTLPGNDELGKLARDFLAAADESGTLSYAISQSQPAAELEGLLNYLPFSVGSKITVTVYEYKNGLLSEKASYEASVRGLSGDVIAAQRAFSDVSNNKYYLAVLEVSYA